MADAKISALAAGTTPNAGDTTFVAVQAGANVKLTDAQVAAGLAVTYGVLKNKVSATDPTVNDDTLAGYAVGSRWVNSTTHTVFVCASATAAAAIWEAQGMRAHPGYVSGNFYVPYPTLLTAGVAVGASVIKFVPFIPPVDMTVRALGLRVGTAGSSNFQCAIYDSQLTAGAGYRPTGNALGSTGNIVNTAIGVINGALGADVPLVAGRLYFLALNVNDATMVCQVPNILNAFMAWLLGTATQANIMGTTSSVSHLSFASAFGAWPDMTANACTEVLTGAFAYIHVKAA